MPHAELLTLNELAQQLNIESTEEFTKKLQNHNINFENTHAQTLEEIASANETTPQEIYAIISRKAGNQMQGAGIGRKTLDDFAQELNKNTEEILAILKDNNISAERNQTLRTIGDNNNLPPRDIYELISKQ